MDEADGEEGVVRADEEDGAVGGDVLPDVDQGELGHSGGCGGSRDGGSSGPLGGGSVGPRGGGGGGRPRRGERRRRWRHQQPYVIIFKNVDNVHNNYY